MIDHLTLGVQDFTRSATFYDAVLGTLGAKRLHDLAPSETDGVRVCGYGTDTPWFWLAEERAASGLIHIAFRAPSRASVDAFHAVALGSGGTDNGGPGLRPHYHDGYYAAFVLDPDGHNIEAVCHGG